MVNENNHDDNHDDNSICEKFRFEILKNYFEDRGIVRHQIDTFNDYLNNGISRVVKESDIIIDTKEQKYTVSFGDVYIPNPSLIEEDRSVRLYYPHEARTRDLTYDAPIHVDIIEKLELEGQEPEITHHRRVIIGRTPIMLGSDKCNLKDFTKKELVEKGECEWDSGGYFIIRGKERVLIGQLRGVYNQPIVLQQKAGERYKYICEVRSMSEETGHSVLIQIKVASDDRGIVFTLPNIKEVIPVGIVFKALGYLSEEEIRNIIGLYDEKTSKYIKYIIRDSEFIKTQNDALKYIGQYSAHTIKDEKRADYALQIVENELLPHMGISSTIKEKVYFLGNMINKLLRANIGERHEDDRDNYVNKRVEMAGVLCCDLFRALFKRFLKSIQVQLDKKKQHPDILSIISRTSSITLGLKHSFCVPAGTMVTMSNGLSYPIEKLSELSNEHEKVLGWNGTGMISTRHGGLVNQGVKDTVKLTFEDGRKLICTPDHKILVLNEDKTTEWVEAMNIPIHSRIVTGLDNPTDNIDEDLGNKWEFETYNGVNRQIWTVSTQEDRNKTLALMRILGYIICDGHLPGNKKNNGMIYLGTMFDVDRFIDDYKLVTGLEESPVVNNVVTDNWGTTYSIRISNELTYTLKNIEGVITGKKVTQERSIPSFLLEDNCPKSVIREFLGGLFGGDGHSPLLDIRKGQRTCVQGIAFSWTTEEENLEVLKEVFENIQKLLEKVGVKDTYINGPYEQEENDRHIYRIRLSPNTDFHKYVGFRYCIHKTYKLNIVSSYWRMEEEIKKQYSFIINTVNKLKEDDKKMTIKKALDIARKELTDREYILNNYYSLSSVRDIGKRRENGRSAELKYLQEKFGVPDAKDFINDMGALYMFEGKYANNRDTVELPCFSMKLMDIRNDKTQVVYDVTNVEICKSFFSGGFAISNSTGNWGIQKNNYIRTGVSQVLSRMTHGSVISHLRRINIPIGKEGKNAKIRQIHSSQIMYICPAECFDPETPILTWEGKIKLAKDIVVGDLLIDDNGNPTRVKSTCSGFKNMYEVQQEKKNFMNYTVTDNHILTLKIQNHLTTYTRNSIGYNAKNIDEDGMVYELTWFDKSKLCYNTETFYHVKHLDDFTAKITDDDIIDITIEEYLKLPDDIKKSLVGFKSRGINWNKQEADLDNLLEIINKTKDLPNNYIINDRNTRLKVLSILLEHYCKNCKNNKNNLKVSRTIEISRFHKNIIEKIKFLLGSLGFPFNIEVGIFITTITIIGQFMYEVFYDTESYLESPIKVVQKEFAPFVGWQLEGNGRFLLSDFTTVHNTPKFWESDTKSIASLV